MYKKGIKDVKYCTKIRGNNKVKYIDFPDDLSNKMPELFKMLEPTQHSKLLNIFKKEFTDFVIEKLNNYCDEKDLIEFKEKVINTKLNEFDYLLNSAFDKDNKIHKESLVFKKLKSFQEVGGENFLKKSIEEINSNFNQFLNYINNLKYILQEEENIDSLNRKKFENDEKSKICKMNYFEEIKPSNQLNKSFYSNIDFFHKSSIKANQIDLTLIQRIQKLLIEPIINDSTNELGFKSMTYIKYISSFKIDDINNHIDLLNKTQEKKNQAEQRFKEIPEFKQLIDEITDFRLMIDNIVLLKDNLINKAVSLSDINLSELSNFSNNNNSNLNVTNNKDNFVIESSNKEENNSNIFENNLKKIIVSKSNEILNSKNFKDDILSLENLNSLINNKKNIILESSKKLLALIAKEKTENNEDKSIIISNLEDSNTSLIKEKLVLSKALFDYDNKKVLDITHNIKQVLNEFQNICNLIKYSHSFYYQNNNKIRLLHVNILKYILDRTINIDNFLNRYNNGGVSTKSIGMSNKVKSITNEINKLNEEKPVESLSLLNAVTNLTLNMNAKDFNKKN